MCVCVPCHWGCASPACKQGSVWAASAPFAPVSSCYELPKPCPWSPSLHKNTFIISLVILFSLYLCHLSHKRTACCRSCCRRRYVLVLMVCKRRCVSGERSWSATQRSLRLARGRYQQNLYWSCFLEETNKCRRMIYYDTNIQLVVSQNVDPISHKRCFLLLHSPSACMFESGAQQEVGVKEDVTQAAFPLAHIHHKAVTHQLTSLDQHTNILYTYIVLT